MLPYTENGAPAEILPHTENGASAEMLPYTENGASAQIPSVFGVNRGGAYP